MSNNISKSNNSNNFNVKKNNLLILYILIIFIGLFTSYNQKTSSTFSMPISNKTIFIDAGHGDWDPGKVSESGILEKDINLQIANYLQIYLEQSGSFVLNTRIDDTVLGTEKSTDMQERKAIANEKDADLLISIHQNSYTSENVKGAQVFYYESSESSKNLAETVQNRLVDLDKSNTRVSKSNDNYYILKQTSIPAIIVECGFLSNTAEANMLTDENYQKNIAWAIYMGVLDYYQNI